MSYLLRAIEKKGVNQLFSVTSKNSPLLLSPSIKWQGRNFSNQPPNSIKLSCCSCKNISIQKIKDLVANDSEIGLKKHINENCQKTQKLKTKWNTYSVNARLPQPDCAAENTLRTTLPVKVLQNNRITGIGSSDHLQVVFGNLKLRANAA